MWSICRRIRLQGLGLGVLPLNQKSEAKGDREINVISQDSATLNAKPPQNPAEKLPVFHVSLTSVRCSGYQRSCEPWGFPWGILIPQELCKSCEISALMMMMVRLWWFSCKRVLCLVFDFPSLFSAWTQLNPQMPGISGNAKSSRKNSPLTAPLISEMLFKMDLSLLVRTKITHTEMYLPQKAALGVRSFAWEWQDHAKPFLDDF